MNKNYTLKVRTKQYGFTLIEIIVGIVVLAIALTIITSLIVPAARQSVSPVYQVRAAELGQAMLNEITGRSFDENSDRRGGQIRCGEHNIECTPIDDFGPEQNQNRPQFNDVDDYHCLTNNISSSAPCFSELKNALGEIIAERYPNYLYAISVCYSTAQGGCVSSITPLKRITVTITTPEGQDLAFRSIRGNF